MKTISQFNKSYSEENTNRFNLAKYIMTIWRYIKEYKIDYLVIGQSNEARNCLDHLNKYRKIIW